MPVSESTGARTHQIEFLVRPELEPLRLPPQSLPALGPLACGRGCRPHVAASQRGCAGRDTAPAALPAGGQAERGLEGAGGLSGGRCTLQSSSDLRALSPWPEPVPTALPGRVGAPWAQPWRWHRWQKPLFLAAPPTGRVLGVQAGRLWGDLQGRACAPGGRAESTACLLGLRGACHPPTPEEPETRAGWARGQGHPAVPPGP